MNTYTTLLITCTAAMLATPVTSQSSESNPFDKFRTKTIEDVRPDNSASKEVAPQPAAPAPAPSPAPAKTSASSGTRGSGPARSVYCSGNVVRSTGSLEVQKVPFEFRTMISPSEGKHKVVNVITGPLFQSGSSYNATFLANDIIVLGTEITSKQHWKLSSMRLDAATSRLSGQGTVDLTDIRSRINARLRSKSNYAIPEGGLDAQRKVEVKGSCEAIQ